MYPVKNPYNEYVLLQSDYIKCRNLTRVEGEIERKREKFG
jgi:hypothetical protein